VSALRIAINGFGRIGRSVFRIFEPRPDAEVVAVNDLYDNDQLAYLLKYDTVMGILPAEVESDAESITVGGRRVRMFAERDPEKLPWADLAIDVVIEATGAMRHREKLERHLRAGARKVLLTVPAKDDLDATIVLGANDGELRPEHRLVSNASCTTNCLAPVARVLDEDFGVEDGLFTTVHAYTNSQRLADVPQKDLRRSRAAAENIIPTSTGAARALGRVLPNLAGKLDGIAMRVPVPDGSIVVLACRLRKTPSAAEVNGAMRGAAEGRLKGILEYSEVPLVSSDIIGNSHSSVFDALSTSAFPDGRIQVVAWYDNEWGYSNRVVDLSLRMGSLGPN
jgi:glyceraldehyde 3-phosphate dehydrogenase